jgi:hypothetical protein
VAESIMGTVGNGFVPSAPVATPNG